MASGRTALIAAGTALQLLAAALVAQAQQLRVQPFVTGLSYPVAFVAELLTVVIDSMRRIPKRLNAIRV